MTVFVTLDGNTKDSIRITENMKFDYEDKSEPPNLQEFKVVLIRNLVKRSFFQKEPKLLINMLKLPIIIAPSLLGSQTNHDVEKQSLLDKTIEYEPATFTKFTEMLDRGRIDILNIDKLDVTELKSLGRELNLKKVGDKTGLILRNELINMSKHFMSGQGPCHAYTVKRGRTGGFTDVFCDHLFKVASKIQSVQESVRQVPSTIVHILALGTGY